jgi:hypothetical protein
MKIFLPFIAVVLSLTSAMAQEFVPPPPSRPSNNSPQTIVPPRPSRPSPGTRVEAPPASTIRFGNGAKVIIYRDEFVVMDKDRHSKTIKRPLPDLARPPGGCKFLKNQLDTTACSRDYWIRDLEIYLSRCEGLR